MLSTFQLQRTPTRSNKQKGGLDARIRAAVDAAGRHCAMILELHASIGGAHAQKPAVESESAPVALPSRQVSPEFQTQRQQVGQVSPKYRSICTFVPGIG
jgi:hypothetical protein